MSKANKLIITLCPGSPPSDISYLSYNQGIIASNVRCCLPRRLSHFDRLSEIYSKRFREDNCKGLCTSLQF